MRLTLIIISCGWALSAFGQDVVKDLAHINAYYAEAHSLDLQMTYRIYNDAGHAKPESESSGTYRKKGTFVRSDMGGVLTVQDARYRVTLQQEQQVMVVSLPDTTSLSPVQGLEVRGLLEQAGKTEFLGERNGARGYRLGTENLPGSNLRSVEVWSAIEDGHLTRLVMRFREMKIDHTPGLEPGKYRPYAEIIYDRSVRNGSVDNRHFNTARYVTRGKGALQPTREYADFTLINSTER